jgi:hypothetical protein
MATRAYRDMRRSLPVVLALLLALLAAAKAPQVGVDHAPRSASASSVAQTIEDPPQSSISAMAEPAAACVSAALRGEAARHERVLRTQLIVTVRAARAPPLTRI